jgi:pimeloyl-ACP methyl ester carboxylesterase
MIDPARCVTDTVHHYFQPISWQRVAWVPVTYVLNDRDKPLTPEIQERMVSHVPNLVRLVRLDTGHIPAVTEPANFAAIVAEAARS